jgi:hypothetical protein
VVSIAVTAIVVFAVAFGIIRWSGTANRVAVQSDIAAEESGSQEKPAAIRLRELTTEELFKLAGPSVVELEVFNERNEKTGIGSGFVVAGNGTIITNYHVIRGAYSAKAIFQEGSTAAVVGVLGFDPDRDVAVVRISDDSGKPLLLANSDQLQVGNKVVAIGSPRGLQNTVSDGLVSGIRNGLIQTSTPISPGSSGGPLFNTHGEVIGVAVATATDAQNLNFAVPINWAKRYVTGAQPIPLDEISKQNTVVQSFVQSTISVPAGKRVSWPIEIDRNRMANPELQGSFTSAGGLGGNIRVLVVSPNQVLYDSGRTTSGTLHLPLRPGQYQLVIDNTGSLMFARSVTADFGLRYVK